MKNKQYVAIARCAVRNRDTRLSTALYEHYTRRGAKFSFNDNMNSLWNALDFFLKDASPGILGFLKNNKTDFSGFDEAARLVTKYIEWVKNHHAILDSSLQKLFEGQLTSENFDTKKWRAEWKTLVATQEKIYSMLTEAATPLLEAGEDWNSPVLRELAQRYNKFQFGVTRIKETLESVVRGKQ